MKSVITVALLLVAFPVFAQPLIHSAFSMRGLNTNVKSLSLGNAVTSLNGAYGDPQINPAGVELKEALQLSYTRNEFEVESTDRIISATVGFSRSVISLSFRRVFGSELAYPERDLAAYTRFNSHENYFGLSYSIFILSNLRVGAGVNYLTATEGSGSFVSQQKLTKEEALSFDLGIQYNYPIKINQRFILEPNIGISITDFGKGVNYYSFEEKYTDPLPGRMRFGSGLLIQTVERIKGKHFLGISITGDISKTLNRRERVVTDVDIFYRAMNPFRELTETWTSYEYFDGQKYNTISVKDQLWYHAGIEFQVLESFFLRWGTQKAPEYDEQFSYRSLGIGVDIYFLAFDYNHILIKRGGRFRDTYYSFLAGPHWQITARFPFDGKSPKTILDDFLK